MKLAVVFFAAVSLFAQAGRTCCAPAPPVQYSAATNFSEDIAGVKDSRPGDWGAAGRVDYLMLFYPPTGYQVRVMRVYGDFIAWPKAGSMGSGTYSEVGFALSTTGPSGSARAALSADNCFLFVQNAVLPGNPNPRVPFDFKTADGGLLGPDNTMDIGMFVALNTSGLTIHMEPSFVIVYRFEPIPGATP